MLVYIFIGYASLSLLLELMRYSVIIVTGCMFTYWHPVNNGTILLIRWGDQPVWPINI